MHRTTVALGAGLLLLAVLPANGEIVKGVMGIKGAEMSWWGGMARDAITRQYDVDKNLVSLFCEPGKESYRPGLITFYAKKGKSIDLDKMRESLTATRLSGGTSMSVTYLEITVRGTVSAVPGKGVVLKVTEGEFVLQDDASAKGMTQKVAETVSARTESIVSVTGRVPGWSGRFPVVLKALSTPPATRTLLVTGFETAK